MYLRISFLKNPEAKRFEKKKAEKPEKQEKQEKQLGGEKKENHHHHHHHRSQHRRSSSRTGANVLTNQALNEPVPSSHHQPLASLTQTQPIKPPKHHHHYYHHHHHHYHHHIDSLKNNSRGNSVEPGQRIHAKKMATVVNKSLDYADNDETNNDVSGDPYHDMDRDRPLSPAVSIVSEYNGNSGNSYNGVVRSNTISVFSALYNQGASFILTFFN